ncbi:hypothetical protein D6777_02350 [Candidatus Woesearchaeota archaeon]|nr:MAG: hypothetical protein D6777_02350 [Candidatus Woesearchaeota archaeon]
MKCPGQSLNTRKPEDYVSYQDCKKCGTEVEFFYDDLKRKCHNCGEVVEKDYDKLMKDYGCAQWCDYAESCLGKKTYQKFKETKERASLLEKLIQSIPEEDDEAREFIEEAVKSTKTDELIDTENIIKPLKEKNKELYERVRKYYANFEY